MWLWTHILIWVEGGYTRVAEYCAKKATSTQIQTNRRSTQQLTTRMTTRTTIKPRAGVFWMNGVNLTSMVVLVKSHRSLES